MPRVVGVAFKRVCRFYWFDPGDLQLDVDDRVAVVTARGTELGTVRVPPRELPEEELAAPLKPVLRIATAEDDLQEEQNRTEAASALETCRSCVESLDLPMKLLGSELNFEGSQVTIFFSADGRVDFRELVKDLTARLRCRVLLHQVGARDEARMLGGCGPCGRSYCCASFLSDFAPISMKMAKDQYLFLNPAKYSGACGKLMCCLRFEHETYVDGAGGPNGADDGALA